MTNPDDLSRGASAPFDAASDGTGDPVLAFLTNSLLTPFVVVDASGQIEAASPAALADLGHGPDQLTGQPSEIVLGIGTDALGQIAQGGAGTMLTHPASGPMRLRVAPLTGSRPDGGWLVEMNIRPGLEPTGAAGDRLTERSIELEKVLADLTERYEELNRFSGLISHDLQAPTRRLLSFAQLLRADLPHPSPDVESSLGAVESGAAHLLRITTELLAYSRNTRRPVTVTDVDAQVVLEHTIDQLSLALDHADAQVEIAARLPIVRASETLLSVVFQNLLQNAVKYRHDDRAPTIVVTPTRTGDHVRIDFADNGIGLPPNSWSVIFEPFRRLHPKEIEHTGLGLATVRRILERFGGTIVVTASEPDVGTTFTLVLETSDADQ